MMFTKVKEPVLLGAALTVTADAGALLAGASTTTQAILHGVTVAWVAWIVRSLSTPTQAVEQQVEVGKYVGAVEHQQLAALKPRRPLRAQPVDG